MNITTSKKSKLEIRLCKQYKLLGNRNMYSAYVKLSHCLGGSHKHYHILVNTGYDNANFFATKRGAMISAINGAINEIKEIGISAALQYKFTEDLTEKLKGINENNNS